MKSPLLAVVGVVALAALSGCTAPAPQDTNGSSDTARELTIGVSLISQQIPILASITQEFVDRGQAGAYTTVISDPNNDASAQIQQVRAQIASGVDGLVISPVNREAMDPVIKEAVEAGIPVVMVANPPLTPMRGVVTVDFDWGDYGYLVGSAMAQCLNEKFDGEAEIALITTTALGGAVVTDRMASMKQAIIDNAPGVEIVAEADGKSDRVEAVTAARTILEANPDVVGFTGIGDSEVLGALQAFRDAGNDPADGCFVGLDASEEGIAAFEAGDLYAEFDPQYANWMRVASVVLPAMARDPESGFWNANTLLFTPAQAAK